MLSSPQPPSTTPSKITTCKFNKHNPPHPILVRVLDLFGGYRRCTIIGQCKGGTTVTSKDVTVLEGTLSRYDRRKTIAIKIR
ncbi:8710_t:CDS:2, partial [Paraglomus occultum]